MLSTNRKRCSRRKIIPGEIELERGGLSGTFGIGHGRQQFDGSRRIGRKHAGKSQAGILFGILLQDLIPEFR